MKSRLATSICLSFLLCSAQGFAQPGGTVDVWKPLRHFAGTWVGTGSGSSGESSVENSFEFILDNKFLQIKNKAVFEPQELNPKGEVHEDIGYISYDKARGKFVLREFLIEGYVNHYNLDTLIVGKRLVFLSESLENAPAGMRARLTYEIVDQDHMRSAFDLAFPGKEFSCMSQQELERRKP